LNCIKTVATLPSIAIITILRNLLLFICFLSPCSIHFKRGKDGSPFFNEKLPKANKL
jgi:hypothetical protein